MNYNKLQIDKENDSVRYNDEIHKYWTKDENLSCISVTTLIHQFTTFDEYFWSCYKTLEKLMGDDFIKVKKSLLAKKIFNYDILKDLNIPIETFNLERELILKEWAEKRDTSCIRGTGIHAKLETGHLKGDTKELKMLKLGGSFNTNVSNKLEVNKRGVYPELLLSRISKDKKLRIAGQADLVIVDGFDVYILDYKGLPLDTEILTTNGYKYLKNITKDDIIFDKDGNKTNILNISDIHYNKCYKIKFDNNDEIIADHEHRWLISFRKVGRKGKFYKDVVMTTEELLEAYRKSEANPKRSDLKPKILNPKPLNTDYKELPIDPYILGTWLGDGTSIAGSITTGNNSNLWKEIERRGYEIGDNISGKTNIQTRTLFGLRTELNKLNLLNNKHIPDIYLLASYDQRLDLLRGFMDADGHYNETRKRFVMTTTREYQANYLRDLLATLGVKPTILPCMKQCGEKRIQGWDICFTMEENPFLIRNQEELARPKIDKASFRNIKLIEEVETVATKCLEVDSPSHTFLFSRSLIVTHNTNKKIDTKSYFDSIRKRKSMMKYPLNNIEDSNFWHYTLQLSTYAWMIEKIDPRFNIKLLMLIHIDHDNNVTNYECEYRKKEVERMLVFHKKSVEQEIFKKSREKFKF